MGISCLLGVNQPVLLPQVEGLFQAMQRSSMKKSSGTGRQKLAVLDLKRATAVGIRMSRLRYSILCVKPQSFMDDFSQTLIFGAVEASAMVV